MEGKKKAEGGDGLNFFYSSALTPPPFVCQESIIPFYIFFSLHFVCTYFCFSLLFETRRGFHANARRGNARCSAAHTLPPPG